MEFKRKIFQEKYTLLPEKRKLLLSFVLDKIKETIQEEKSVYSYNLKPPQNTRFKALSEYYSMPDELFRNSEFQNDQDKILLLLIEVCVISNFEKIKTFRFFKNGIFKKSKFEINKEALLEIGSLI